MITTMLSDQNGSPPRVEVITSVQRRRRWPTAEKIRLVEETMQSGMSVSYVARRAGVAPSLLFNWRRRMLEGGLQAVEADEDVVGTSRVRELERPVRELERLLGRKTMEVEILKHGIAAAHDLVCLNQQFCLDRRGIRCTLGNRSVVDHQEP